MFERVVDFECAEVERFYDKDSGGKMEYKLLLFVCENIHEYNTSIIGTLVVYDTI